jgi:hypothetical protein
MILSVPSHPWAKKEVMPTVQKSEAMCGTGCTNNLRCKSQRTTILKTDRQWLEVLKKIKSPWYFYPTLHHHSVFIFIEQHCSYTEVSGCQSTFPEIDRLTQKLKGDMHELRADLWRAACYLFLSIKMHCTINNVKFHVLFTVISGCRTVCKVHSVTGKLFILLGCYAALLGSYRHFRTAY